MSDIQFIDFQGSRESSRTTIISDTSNVLNNFGFVNHQIELKTGAHHYTTMNSCGSEDVSGERFSVVIKGISAFDAIMVVNVYQGQMITNQS